MAGQHPGSGIPSGEHQPRYGEPLGEELSILVGQGPSIDLFLNHKEVVLQNATELAEPLREHLVVKGKEVHTRGHGVHPGGDA
jgi:hypothetical protein